MERYAITDRRLFAAAGGGPEPLARQCAEWAAGGVEWIQLREKDLFLPELAGYARALARSIGGARTRLLVNGLSPVVARECGADGVHLPAGAGQGAVAEARAHGRVSASCHTLAEVDKARGADLILWAPVFSKSADGAIVLPGTGLAALHQACVLAAPAPVFALGGVTPANAPECIAAGARGVAGIRLFHGKGWQGLA